MFRIIQCTVHFASTYLVNVAVMIVFLNGTNGLVSRDCLNEAHIVSAYLSFLPMTDNY
jgi:hypothetical protein